MNRCLAWLASLLALSLSGCGNPLTELVVVIDTDYLVPGELDEVVITIVGPEGDHAPVLASLFVEPLPLSLGVVHRGGPLGPVTIEAAGSSGGVVRVRRTISTSFVLGEAREVRLDLWRACEGISCPEETTCVAGSCGNISVPGVDLPVYGGDHRLDASWDASAADGPFEAPADADTDAPIEAPLDAPTDAPIEVPLDAPLDAPIDAPMGGALDAPTDAARDAPVDAPIDAPRDTPIDAPRDTPIDAPRDTPIDVPGDAGRDAGMPDGGVPGLDAGCSCTLDHATARCSGAACIIVSCATGYSDCDGSSATGCERSIRTLDDCGACDRVCGSPAGTTSCSDGVCRIVSCSDTGQADCNGALSDGCETRIDGNDDGNCGACGRRCTGGDRCRGGRCGG